jgi:hypothetical protein
VNERLDHLGIAAGVCQEIGLAAWLDAQDDRFHERVSVGTATAAMILNGLGFSNRQLYLVPQFFADKPVETLLGPPYQAVYRREPPKHAAREGVTPVETDARPGVPDD